MCSKKCEMPGRARALVPRSDAIENVERDVRNVVIGLHQHLHPVFQRPRRDRKFLLLLRGRDRRRCRTKTMPRTKSPARNDFKFSFLMNRPYEEHQT